MLYYGHAYYAMSAGYDTQTREKNAALMYAATGPSVLDSLVQENGITYIIVGSDRENERNYFYVREYVIAATYEAVFSYGEGDNRFTIYDTSKKIQR